MLLNRLPGREISQVCHAPQMTSLTSVLQSHTSHTSHTLFGDLTSKVTSHNLTPMPAAPMHVTGEAGLLTHPIRYQDMAAAQPAGTIIITATTYYRCQDRKTRAKGPVAAAGEREGIHSGAGGARAAAGAACACSSCPQPAGCTVSTALTHSPTADQ